MNQPPDHYKMLGIARDAPPEAVRAAYRRRAQKYHPDRYKGAVDADATMARINRAYEVLSDPEHRARYDASFAPAAPAAPVEVVMESAEKRSWLLLWAVISFTVLTLGWVALRTLVPAPARIPAPALVRQAPADETPLVPVPAIEPWKPAAPTARVGLPGTEPVERLMREGTMNNPPSRRKEGASAQ
jgi:DnaJ-domain-containing protein 1